MFLAKSEVVCNWWTTQFSSIVKFSFISGKTVSGITCANWKVVAKDDNGGETESEIFSFTTQVDYSSEALIGQWYFESIEEREPLSDCEKTSYLEFSSVGTAFTILYADSPDGGCNPLIVSEFTYELISETTIEFTNVSDNDTFTTEIVSVSDTELVISGIGFFPPSTLIKG